MGAFVEQTRAGDECFCCAERGVPQDRGVGVRCGSRDFSNTFLLCLDEMERCSPVRSWLVRGRAWGMYLSQQSGRGVIGAEFENFEKFSNFQTFYLPWYGSAIPPSDKSFGGVEPFSKGSAFSPCPLALAH